jgi:hypothetical protein
MQLPRQPGRSAQQREAFLKMHAALSPVCDVLDEELGLWQPRKAL